MKVIQKNAFKVVGIKVKARWEELWTEMPQAWKRFMQRSEEIENRINDKFIDLSLQKDGDEYTQLICCEVSNFGKTPDGMTALEIPTQKYISYRHHGSLTEIAASFGKMYDWAEENGLSPDDFKIDIGYTLDGNESAHELFVRISRQAKDSQEEEGISRQETERRK